jgi:predicted MPP superfamily phosphohydrolase
MAAALCLFLLLLNRRLILIEDSAYKKPLIALTFAVLMISSSALGYVAGFSLWVLLPLLVLVGIAVGEVRRAVIRYRFRGSPPVSRENVNVSLTRPFTTTALQVAHYEVDCPQLKGDGFTVAHISDLHVTDDLPYDYYVAAMKRVNEAQPDLIFMTGDFVTQVEFVPLLPGILKVAKGRCGVFAILGNHDYWADANSVAEAIRSADVALLYNGCQRIPVGDGDEILICGYEAPWNKSRWQMPVITDDEVVLALTHTADNIYRLSRAGVTATFAGHYHGGQIRIPFLSSVVVPSKYGRRFDHGHFIVDGTHLFVTSGIGAAMPPLRIYCQPDIFVVKFRKSRE